MRGAEKNPSGVQPTLRLIEPFVNVEAEIILRVNYKEYQLKLC